MTMGLVGDIEKDAETLKQAYTIMHRNGWKLKQYHDIEINYLRTEEEKEYIHKVFVKAFPKELDSQLQLF
jgi:hypothetical protein